MRKKKSSHGKSTKKEESMINKKIIIVIAILLIAYLVVNSLIPNKDDDFYETQQPKDGFYGSCEERCANNNDCLGDCYIDDVNSAVLESSIDACNNIPHEESKQSCSDKVNLKLATLNNDASKCDLIVNSGLKENCLQNVQ